MLEQPAEAFLADDVGCGESSGWRRPSAGQQTVVFSLMRAFEKIMRQVLVNEMPQMILAEHDEMIEALALDALHPAFREGVEVGSERPDLMHFQAVGGEDRIELLGELAVVVSDQNRRLLRQLGEVHGDVAGLLRHPLGVGMGTHAGHVHAAAADVNEEQHEVVDQARHRPHLFREEVAGPQRGRMLLDERIPGPFAAFRPRVDAVFLEDVDDRGTADPGDAELFELAKDARVAPGVVTRQAQNQVADLLRGFRAPRFAADRRTRGLPLLAAHPACERPWRDDRDQVLDSGAERHAKFDQPLAFIDADIDAFGQLATQEPVLGLEVLDLAGKLAVGGCGEKKEEGTKESIHRGVVRNLLQHQMKSWFLYSAAGPLTASAVTAQNPPVKIGKIFGVRTPKPSVNTSRGPWSSKRVAFGPQTRFECSTQHFDLQPFQKT